MEARKHIVEPYQILPWAGFTVIQKDTYLEPKKEREEISTVKETSYIADWQVGYPENQPDTP